MNSLSTNTFSPVAFSLGLLLVMTAVFPTLVPRGEDSKDDTTSNRPPLTSSEQIENLISTLLEISDVKNKMCDNHESCKNSKEAPTENNPNLPKLARKDGCFHSGFNQETCLRRLTTGLLEFQVYLEYLQNTFEGHAQAMKTGTKALVNILRQKMKNPVEATIPDPTTNTGLLEKMHAQKNWLKTMTTTIHLILRSLEDFQQFTQRAIWM